MSGSTFRKPTGAAIKVLYPTLKSNAVDIETDIFAVHGLGSNADWAWLHKQSQLNWLEAADMLPSVVPKARIMTYSYESRWHSRAPQTRLELCGEDFIECLHNFRRDTPDRPIILIGHSLGGLVICFGLLYADRVAKYRYLVEQTAGFAALGTPFRGSKSQALASIICKLLAPAGSHDGILRSLEPDEDALRDKVHSFCQLKDRLSLPCCCFFELLDSDYGRKVHMYGTMKTRTVDETSAHIPGWDRFGLNADHFNLNKFEGPDNHNFSRVSAQIREMCEGAKGLMQTRSSANGLAEGHFIVPIQQANDFIGREEILGRLVCKVAPGALEKKCLLNAITGLGGVGKTSLALEVVRQVRTRNPACSVFWAPALNESTFANALRQIGRQLKVPDINEEAADVLTLVSEALRGEKLSEWLLVIDNLDDLRLFQTGSSLLRAFLPNPKGSILITTRNMQIAVDLGLAGDHVETLREMSSSDAKRLLQQGLGVDRTLNSEDGNSLVGFLANLPLAIKQASAYLLTTGLSVSRYLEYCQKADATFVELLSRESQDLGLYGEGQTNAIARTWLVSFEQVRSLNELAGDILEQICLFLEKDIPRVIIADEDDLVTDEAIGLLKAYGFVIENNTDGIQAYEIHRLVRIAMRVWLEKKSAFPGCVKRTFQRITRYTFSEESAPYAERAVPHMESALTFRGHCTSKELVTMTLLVVGWIEKDNLRLSAAEKNAQEAWKLVGDYQPSEAGYAQALECRRLRAYLCRSFGAFEVAEENLQELLSDCERHAGHHHWMTLSVAVGWAAVKTEMGKTHEAETMLRKVVEAASDLDATDLSLNFIDASRDLAASLLRRDAFAQAEQAARHGLVLADRKGMSQRDYGRWRLSLSLLQSVKKQEKHKDAEKIGQDMIASISTPHTIDALADLAEVYCDLEEIDKCEQVLERLYRQPDTSSNSLRRLKLETMNLIALFFWNSGRRERAMSITEDCAQRAEILLGQEDLYTQKCHAQLADWKRGKFTRHAKKLWPRLSLLRRAVQRKS